MKEVKPRVLILVQFYLPGYKSGGPIRSIEGLIHHLGQDVDFRVLSYDRDRGDELPYPDIECESWNECEFGKVWYVPTSIRKWIRIARFLRAGNFQLVYIQSAFSPIFSIWPLFLRKLGIFKMPVLLIPRGELSLGALSIKPWKKRVFLRLAGIIGLYKGISWQASTALEAREIRASGLLRSQEYKNIFVASNLRYAAERTNDPGGCEKSGGIRLVFISRISPKKNLDFALRVLEQVKCQVCFDIFGPIVDPEHWQNCERLLDHLPDNVIARACGPIEPKEVDGVFQKADLFFLPTRGENFGHVIIESLLAGCPVLISDQTPWRNLAALNAGWDFSLDQFGAFVEAIESQAGLSVTEWKERREAAVCAGRQFLDLENAIEDNRAMFSTLIVDSVAS